MAGKSTMRSLDEAFELPDDYLQGPVASALRPGLIEATDRTTGEDRTLKIWDLTSGIELRSLTGHGSWFLDLAKGARTLSGHDGEVWAVAVTPDGRLVISASQDRTLKIWELASGVELHTLSGHHRRVMAVAVTPDGRHAISASDDRTLSHGCIRLQDAERLGRWLMGREPQTASRDPEQNVLLPSPVPIYVTYLTAQVADGRISFVNDIYGRDTQVAALR